MSPAAMVPQTGLKGAGVLVAVAGPSGAGKDSLISVARRHFAGNGWVSFPQRIVTRDAVPAAEAHGIASLREFEKIEQTQGFAVSWRAHGHAYGIPASIDDDVGEGRIVIVNVSRLVIEQLRRRYRRVHVVHVTAAAEILAERLRARGRESDAEITLRVMRGEELERPAPPVTVVDNSGAFADAADAFLNILAAYIPAGERESRW